MYCACFRVFITSGTDFQNQSWTICYCYTVIEQAIQAVKQDLGAYGLGILFNGMDDFYSKSIMMYDYLVARYH